MADAFAIGFLKERGKDMYVRILKKDLRRRKTMNIILFLFIFMVSMFVSSSVNNILSISTAMDGYFEKAEVPDYWIAVLDDASKKNFEVFAAQEKISYRQESLWAFSAKKVQINGKTLEYGNTFSVSEWGDCVTTIFDDKDQPLKEVKPGEIYLTAEMMNSFDIKKGDRLTIQTSDEKLAFVVAGSTKDALYGSDMMGMTRCLVNSADYKKVGKVEKKTQCESYAVYSREVKQFEKKLNARNDIMVAVSADKATIQKTYLMDMIIASILLVVSICLILISFVILRFAIVFTMKEELPEIGIMKAIGIKSRQIRGLYAVKYFAISVVGGVLGFLCGIPFGRMLLQKVSQNIVMQNSSHVLVNFLVSLLVVGMVMLFCYLVTRRINRIRPVEAIRKGATGERFKKKGLIRLGRGHLPVIPFLAVNDIVSCFRRFGILLLAFTIGILLVILPINTKNTLQSEHLLTWFSMTECDLCINRNDIVMMNGVTDHRELEQMLREIREKLKGKKIPAKAHIECVYRMNLAKGDNHCSSMAFSGRGEVTADEYSYTAGSAPMFANEVAVTRIIAEKIGAKIGDEVTIYHGDRGRKYMITGYVQTMNNMGEGIRFSEKEPMDDRCMAGFFAVQIRYTDHPDEQVRKERKEIIGKLFPDNSVQSPGEYIDEMMGGLAGQINSVTVLILFVVICINILVTVLMMKSFLAGEQGEIGMLKAIGFQNRSLIFWQCLRIGIVQVCATVVAALISTPLSQLIIAPVFQMMGAESIIFEIVPWEVYVVYPLCVMAVTIVASFFTAQVVRRISPVETKNIE